MTDSLTLMTRAQGDKWAVIDDRPDGTITRWTYAELEANANKLARVLLRLGATAKQKIVWCGQNSAWLAAMTHAARKLGAIAVPLNYRLTAEEATYVVDNSDATIVFADVEYASLFHAIRPNTPQVREVLIFGGPPLSGQQSLEVLLPGVEGGELELGIDPGVSGTMIYTSGTTGKPKGAVRSNVQDPTLATRMLEYIGYRADDIYISTGPLYHSGPGGFMATAFGLGNTVILQHKFDAEDWLRLVSKYKVSSTFSAPTPIRRICQLPDEMFKRYDVSSMRVMIANAAPWSFALKQEYLKRFPAHSLFEVYGSTELGVNTILRPEFQLSKPGSCGKPSPGVEIFLFDEDGKVITEPNKPGELYARSANVFSTYHKAHEKYMEDRRGDMQTVGDIAYFDEEGFYYICDRKKDMIISGGVNIYPAEIEAALESHPDIMDVAVFGVPSEEWGENVHATLVIRKGSGLTEAAIQAYGRDHLAGYKVPRSIAFIDEIPRNGSGKILKRELRAPYWEGRKSKV